MGRRSAWRLWFWWVLATGLLGSLALIASIWLVFLSVAGDAEVAFSDDNAIFPLGLFGCCLLFIGPLIGLAQGLVLRFARGSKHWQLWIVSDTIGVVTVIAETILVGEITS